jgi:hypothetical protein
MQLVKGTVAKNYAILENIDIESRIMQHILMFDNSTVSTKQMKTR